MQIGNKTSILSITAAILLLAVFVACGGDDDEEEPASTNTTSPSTPAGPSPVSGLIVAHLNESLRLTWSVVETASNYEVRYKEEDENEYGDEVVVAAPEQPEDEDADPITEVTHTIMGLDNDTNYDLQVRWVSSNDVASPWASAQGRPFLLATPTMTLATNTGETGDAFTADASITITAPEGATVTVSMTTNGTEHDFDDGQNEFVLPMAGTTNVDLAMRVPAIVPAGTNTNALVLTGIASLHGQEVATAMSLSFTLVNAIVAADVSAVTLELDDDTGDDDSITTNAGVVLANIPSGVVVSFAVTTNSMTHAQTVELTADATNDFGLGTITETLEVSVTPTFTRHGHFVAGEAFEYTLLLWPSTVTVSYTDDGDDTADGVTTSSVLMTTGFSAFESSDIKLSSYQITNTSTMMLEDAVDIAEGDQESLDSGYRINMRAVKPLLGANEKIHSVTFDYKGHTVDYTFNPALRYVVGFFNRKFDVATNPYGIAITSADILLVTSTSTHAVHFYKTDGTTTNMDLELTPDDSEDALTSTNQFGSMGTQTNQFNEPYDIAVGSDGKIYVADLHNNRVQIFNANFSLNTNITTGVGAPSSLYLHEDHLYVAANVSRIQSYALDDLEQGSSTPGNRVAVAVDSNDVHHVLNTINDRVEAWTGSPSTSFTATSGHTYNLRPSGSESDGASSTPYDIVVGPTTGWLYISDPGHYASIAHREQVVILEYNGNATSNPYTLIGVLGRADRTPGAGDGEFDNPRSMLIHGGELYVVDSGNGRVQVFDVPE